MKTLYGAKHQTVINFPFKALFPLPISYINIPTLLEGNQMIKSKENFNFIPPISLRSINQQRFPLISFHIIYILLHRKFCTTKINQYSMHTILYHQQNISPLVPVWIKAKVTVQFVDNSTALITCTDEYVSMRSLQPSHCLPTPVNYLYNPIIST